MIGLVGLGRMGFAIASRLRAQSVDVIGWDWTPAARQRLADAGFAVADSARGVAEASATVISTITDDAGVRALFHGEQGFLAGDVAGKLFIEMSTLQPMTVRDLANAAATAGAALIDAPVLGSVPTVLAGQLTVLAGGEAGTVARARTVLDHLAARVIHMGPAGSGSAMKLAVNLGLAAYLQSLAEGLALGRREGLDIDQMLEALTYAPTANAMLANKMAVLRGGSAPTTLDIATLRKDVLSAIATGALAGVPMPTASGVCASLSAAVAAGCGGNDIGELPRFHWERMVR